MALGVVAVLLLALAPGAVAAPPANDNFADAEDLGSTLPVDITRSNVEATEESEEPFLPFTAGHSVWFQWEAPDTGFVTMGSCAADIPLSIAIFTGTELGSLTEVADGNANDGPSCAAGHGHRFSFRALEGTTYTIMVDGDSFYLELPNPVTEGEFEFHIEATPPPANNDFQDAIPLTEQEPSEVLGLTATASGYSWGADKEVAEPAHAGNVGGASVWYVWTAPYSGAAIVHTCCGWSPLIGVYTGNTVGSLTPADPAPGPPFGARVNAIAGVTYRIAVDGEFDSGAGLARTGGFRITATMPWQKKSAGADPARLEAVSSDVTPPGTKISRRVLKRVPPIWIFGFSSNEPGSTFQCRLDKRPFKQCRSSKTFKGLKPGQHAFRVRAIDPSGNVDKSPAVARFTVPGKARAKR